MVFSGVVKKPYQSLEDNSTINMQQLIYRKLTPKILHLGFIFLLTFSTILNAQEGDPAKGKTLFNTNCAACHQLDRKMTGPALRNIEAKIADEQGLGRDWITNWIHNSAGVIKSGDAYANQIFNEFNQTSMTPFPQLSDQDISDILAYTAQEPAAPAPTTTTAVASNTTPTEPGISNKIILGALAVLFGLLAMALFLVRKTLNRFAAAKGIEVAPEDKTIPIWRAFVKNQFLVLVTCIFLLLASAYFAFGWMMQIGVDQGYQPVQPIHFSHKIHAGDNGIDCKYCHSAARVSKTSGIPSLNVCMNCHKSIYEYKGETTPEFSKEFYDGEIKKLYAAAGWSDTDQAYTGEPQPVKWIRIHNLPDFAYFNHSQHVTVAGVECQTCHGPVETMDEVSQFAPLTMGWCIDCHRTTEIKAADNPYYKKIHEQLSKKYGLDKLTEADMGGLECGKCHY